MRGTFAHLDDGREALAREEVTAEAGKEERDWNRDVEGAAHTCKLLLLPVQRLGDGDDERPPAH